MSNVHELKPRRDRVEEAGAWIAKLDRGLTAAEHDALEHWLDEDAENRRVFLDVAGLWDKMDAIGRLAEMFPEPNRTRRHGVWLAAALFVLAVAFGLWNAATSPDRVDGELVTESGAPGVSRDFSTLVGERASHTLADGSQLILNTASTAQFRMTDSDRLFVLRQGEAHLAVADDASRPFTVYAGSRMFQVVGTAFNIELTGTNAIELTVTDGQVLVERRSQSPSIDDSPRRLSSASSLLVSAGEELRLVGDVDEEAVESIDQIDIDARLSWRQGNLVFRGESLAEAISEISRYTTVTFVFEDPALKTRTVAGLYRAGDIDGLLRTLEDNLSIAHERINDDTIVLSAR